MTRASERIRQLRLGVEKSHVFAAGRRYTPVVWSKLTQTRQFDPLSADRGHRRRVRADPALSKLLGRIGEEARAIMRRTAFPPRAVERPAAPVLRLIGTQPRCCRTTSAAVVEIERS